MKTPLRRPEGWSSVRRAPAGAMPLKGGVGDGGAAVAVGVAGVTTAVAAGLPTCKTAAQNKPMGGRNVSMSPHLKKRNNYSIIDFFGKWNCETQMAVELQLARKGYCFAKA